MTKLNGLTKWIGLGIVLVGIIVSIAVRAAVVEEKINNLKEIHDANNKLIYDDLRIIKEDIKKILEKI